MDWSAWWAVTKVNLIIGGVFLGAMLVWAMVVILWRWHRKAVE